MNDNLYFNFEKWDKNSHNILFITGISGSGKSTLAKQICEKYSAEYVELDMITHRIGKPDRFKNKVSTGRIKNGVLLEYVNTVMKDNQYTSGNWGTYDSEKLHEGLIRYIKDNYYANGKLYVIEGTHFYIKDMNIDIELLRGEPIIIKTTGIIRSLCRRIKRRINRNNDSIHTRIIDFFKYDCSKHNFIEYYDLKKFIKEIR